jgi:hypothetical protein
MRPLLLRLSDGLSQICIRGLLLPLISSLMYLLLKSWKGILRGRSFRSSKRRINNFSHAVVLEFTKAVLCWKSYSFTFRYLNLKEENILRSMKRKSTVTTLVTNCKSRLPFLGGRKRKPNKFLSSAQQTFH